MIKMTKQRFCVVALVLSLTVVGCGVKGPEMAKVSGKVTLPDGTPLPGGRVDFRSVNTGNMVSGVIKADGSYEALTPLGGEYKVSVENKHLEGVQPPPEGLAPMPGADQKYVEINPVNRNPNSSGFQVTVSSKTQTFDVHLH